MDYSIILLLGVCVGLGVLIVRVLEDISKS
jgi:hypothetical protein